MIRLPTLLVLLLVCTYAHAHADEHHTEERMSRSLVARHNVFRSTCGVDAACVLQNEVTEGPYYYDTQYVRENITEGKSGIPFTIYFTVVDYNTCDVISNAAVDLWHCDASGVYSHYQNSQNNGGTNTTFLRGIQLTDSTGVATLKTILPGWYTGRTIHMHVKVHTGGSSVDSLYSGGSVLHTGQVFFNESFMESYKQQSPYSSSTQTFTALTSDSIYSGAGDIAIMTVRYNDESAGYSGGVSGYITLGVNPSSTSTTTTTSPSTSGSDISNSASNTLFSLFAVVCALIAALI